MDRFVNPQQKIFIIDPAQRYIGLLDKMDEETRFFYQRPKIKLIII